MAQKVTIKTLRSSDGPRVDKGDALAVWYAGELAADRTAKFDSNYDFVSAISSRDPFVFTVGGGEVIKGWDIGLAGQHVGSVLELTIPAKLAYGVDGRPPSIPSNSDLVFTVELIASKAESSTIFSFPDFKDLPLSNDEIKAIVSFRKSLQTSSLLSNVANNIVGSDLDNELNGLDGNSSRSDILIGFKGTDVLNGGIGPDLLIGGPGLKTYFYDELLDAPMPEKGQSAMEMITGFNPEQGDIIDLSSLNRNTNNKIQF